jgi:hypothetical protein
MDETARGIEVAGVLIRKGSRDLGFDNVDSVVADVQASFIGFQGVLESTRANVNRFGVSNSEAIKSIRALITAEQNLSSTLEESKQGIKLSLIEVS